jgi:hypothetical protein
MTRRKHARLSLPARAVFCGSLIAFSMGIGWSWWSALVSELLALGYAVSLFVTGARDTDIGAVIGRRADERQKLVTLSAARVAVVVALACMIVACVVAGALKDRTVFWSFDLLTVITTIAYFVGLRIYGVDPQADAGDAARYDGRVS